MIIGLKNFLKFFSPTKIEKTPLNEHLENKTPHEISPEIIKKLLSINYTYYRNNNEDLKDFNDTQLLEHYASHGYLEGRTISPLAFRENFIQIDQKKNCLEIGPFFNPLLRGKNVKYIDILSKYELQKRARGMEVNEDIINSIPEIDFVIKDGSLRSITEKFDVVVSSHNLEHQPDLISHLNEVANTLNNNGKFKLIVPDCAHCFDANIPPTLISEVIAAPIEKRKKHSISKIIEHRALTVQNDPIMHWENSINGIKKYEMINISRVKAAMIEYENSQDEYIDVHSWQFRPHTLSDILSSLIQLNMINFKSVSCFGPVRGRNEFCIELEYW